MIDASRLLRLKLKNGLRVLAYRQQRLPLISLGAFVLAGKDQNPLELPGTSSLTARLLDQGTQKYDHQQLARALESTGGHVSTFSQREMSGLSLQLTSNYLALGVELLAEMLCRPRFPTNRFMIEKRKVLSHVKALEDDPSVVGSQLLDRQIYRGTSLQFPILGTVESVNQLDEDDLSRFHRNNYYPENTVIVAVGDLSEEEFLSLIKEYFEEWEPGGRKKELPRLPPRQTEPIQVRHPMGREQVHIYLGHLGIARTCDDYYKLEVMDAILGGGPGFTSRIPRKIRDEMGLAYHAYSDICGSAGVYPGRFVAYAATSPEKMKEALTALVEEIRQVTIDPPTEEELYMARQYLTGSFVFQFQGNDNLARFLLTSELFDLPSDFGSLYPKIIGEVTTEDVTRVARKYLDTINYSAVLVGSIS